MMGKAAKFILCVLIFLVFQFLILSCNRSVPSKLPIGDGGFFSKQPCRPPCFFDIYPGSTTEENVENILKDRDFWEFCDRFDYEESGGQRGIKCNQTFSVYFQKGNKVVGGIGYIPETDMTVQKVITGHGEPNAVFVSISGLPEHSKSVMILYFDHLTTVVRLPEMGIKYEVKPETKVESISYYDKLSYESQRNKFSSDWEGYGFY
jgi:hypothetical protein